MSRSTTTAGSTGGGRSATARAQGGSAGTGSWTGTAVRSLTSWSAVLIAVSLCLLPVVQAPVTADDWPMLVQSYAAYVEGGVLGLAEQKAADSVTTSHVLPVNGALQFAAVLFASVVATALPVSLSDAWGLTQVLWILTALGAATFYMSASSARRIGRRPTFALLGLVAVCTLQIHGHWSNDPVIAYGAVAWGTATAALIYLGCVQRALAGERVAWRWVLGALAAGCLGVLTYELVLGALVGGAVAVLLIVASTWRRRREARPAEALIAGAVMTALPAAVLGAALLVRASVGPSDYTGTAVGSAGGFVSTWLVAMASCLPGAGWILSAKVLGRAPFEPLLAALFLLAVTPLVLAAARTWSVARRGGACSARARPAGARLRVASYVVGPAVASAVAVGIIVLTEKHRAELGGIIGKVYVFYALGALVVTMAIVHLLLEAWGRRRWAGPALTAALVVFGVVQFQINAALSADMHSQWRSAPLIDRMAVEEPVDERCQAYVAFTSRPLNGYDKALIEDSVQRAYAGRFGEQFCPREALSPSGLEAALIGDSSGLEVEGEGRRFWWLTGPQALLRIENPGERAVATRMTLRLTNVPCGTPRTVSLSGASTILELGEAAQQAVELDVTVPAGAVTQVELTVSGEACVLAGDGRPLTLRVEYPIFAQN